MVESEPKVKCCKEGYPKCPYTRTEKTFDYCCIGCDKPGIGAKDHDPGNNSWDDCALCCCPCAFVIDVICYIPMIFGYCTVEKI